MHEVVEMEIGAAFANGYLQALGDVAERADLLDQSWRPARRRDPEQVIRERVAEMEQHARQPGWPGLDAGGVLPSPDWAPDTTALRAEAHRWQEIADQYDPEPCTRCRPRHPVICTCAGGATYAKRDRLGRAA